MGRQARIKRERKAERQKDLQRLIVHGDDPQQEHKVRAFLDEYGPCEMIGIPKNQDRETLELMLKAVEEAKAQGLQADLIDLDTGETIEIGPPKLVLDPEDPDGKRKAEEFFQEHGPFQLTFESERKENKTRGISSPMADFGRMLDTDEFQNPEYFHLSWGRLVVHYGRDVVDDALVPYDATNPEQVSEVVDVMEKLIGMMLQGITTVVVFLSFNNEFCYPAMGIINGRDRTISICADELVTYEQFKTKLGPYRYGHLGWDMKLFLVTACNNVNCGRKEHLGMRFDNGDKFDIRTNAMQSN